MADQSGQGESSMSNLVRKTRKKKNESSADILAGLAKRLDENSSKKSKKKATVIQFRRDPVTGQRVCKTKYRPNRKYRARASTVDVGPRFDFEEDTEQIEHHSDDSYDLLLSDADNLLRDWKKTTRQTWGRRMQTINENWEASRKLLFELMVKYSAPYLQRCLKCSSENALVRCHQCDNYGYYLCTFCDEEVHTSQPLHDREILMGGFYQHVKPTQSVDDEGCLVSIKRIFPYHPVTCPTCGKVMQTICSDLQCIIITMQGRFDLDMVSHYQCGDCLVTVPFKLDLAATIQMGFWPGTPSNICHLFDRDLLEYWDMVQKRMPGVSERSFITSLEDFSAAKGRIGVINISTFSRAFKEWKFCHYELELLQEKDWMTCPACSKQQHSAHVDGNMKLYRFNSAGSRQRNCYYGEAFIASNSKVDEHIQQVYKGSKRKEMVENNSRCGDSNWRAAGNSVKKKRNLDETGLEILGCRHIIAQAAVNMFYGEVYGYAHYLQKVFLIPKKVQFLWYDVICKYWPWLRKTDPTCVQSMKPALSVMHAKAHAWTCQVLWGGRWQQDTGGTTGEEVEQINSHFSRLGNSTKHMLPEGREELLTEHALFWNRKKIENMSMMLSKRFVKVRLQEIESRKKVDQFLEDIGNTDVTDIVIEDWIMDVQAAARDEELARSKVGKITFDEEAYLASVDVERDQSNPLSRNKDVYLIQRSRKLYPKFFEKVKSLGMVKILEELKQKCVDSASLDASVQAGKAQLVEKVQSDLQLKIESLHYSIAQLTANIGKLTDSSKQRSRLRGKLTASKAELKECVDGLKLLHPDNVINLQAIEQGTFPWQEESRQSVPIRVKKMAAELLMESRRFAEEVDLIKREMSSFLYHYKDVVLPALEAEEEELRKKMKEDKAGTPPAPEVPAVVLSGASDATSENMVVRYATNSTERCVIQGRIALVRRGVDFAMQQISSGIAVFRDMLSDNLADIADLVSQCEDDETTQFERSCDSDEEDGADDVVQSCSVDRVMTKATDVDTLPLVHSSVDAHGNMLWTFPVDFSQGCVDGRNGSSACSLIALIICQVVLTQDVQVPIAGALSPLWATMLYQSMVTGNNIYDQYRASLPARYLSAAEACDILARNENLLFEPEEPLPVRLVDDHRLSCIASQLELLAKTPSRKFAMFTISEKTSLFVVQRPDIVYVDTHCHMPDAGAVTVLGSCNRLQDFCRSIWKIEEISPDTFGNLVFLVHS